MKNLTVFKAETSAFIKTRLKELGLSIRHAEELAGVPYQTIEKCLLKGRGTDYENYVAVMKLLRYSVPVYGKLISQGRVQMHDIAEDDIRVSLPEKIEYSPDLCAIEVADESYKPRFYPRTLLFYHQGSMNGLGNLQSQHPRVVKRKDGNIMVVIVRPGSRNDRYDLVAIDGSAQVIKDAELEWCARIDGVKWED